MPHRFSSPLHPTIAVLLTSVSLIAACGSDRSGPFGEGAETATVAGVGGGATGGAGPSSGAGGEASGGGINFTVGSGGGMATGCEKVDFLFVIDNSVSMADQQKALIGSFPSFMQTIQTTLNATSDYHIMVVDTDAETRCTPGNCKSGALGANTLCDEKNKYACTAQFEACDSTLGAGVIHPAGDGASNELCKLQGGNRYIVEGEPDLASAFGCVAKVGLAGHPSERPMDAMVAAMKSEINASGCNKGFLRKDAILVITFISDDPNYEDQGMPQDWYDAVVAAKGGKADSVVVLGLTPDFDGCRVANKTSGKHWSEFIALWKDRGLSASVCSSDYAPFFQQAVTIIDETCDEFIPVN
jgi:hypothetical protein